MSSWWLEKLETNIVPSHNLFVYLSLCVHVHRHRDRQADGQLFLNIVYVPFLFIVHNTQFCFAHLPDSQKKKSSSIDGSDGLILGKRKLEKEKRGLFTRCSISVLTITTLCGCTDYFILLCDSVDYFVLLCGCVDHLVLLCSVQSSPTFPVCSILTHHIPKHCFQFKLIQLFPKC